MNSSAPPDKSRLLDRIEMAIRTHRRRHSTPSEMMYYKHEDQMTEDALRDAAEALKAAPSAKNAIDVTAKLMADLVDAEVMVKILGEELKTRENMVSVPRSLAERSHSMFQSVDPSGSIASEWRDMLDLPRFSRSDGGTDK